MPFYSSVVDAIGHGFYVAMVIQFLFPYKEGSRHKVFCMNALAMFRNALIYALVAFCLDRLVGPWRG